MAFGINPTQTMAGPVATGQSYAQQIAGGMPMEQIIAPGVSYSPEQSGGYTQKDLDFIAKGPAPVMPIAPTTGEVATIPNQMPYAPPGVTQPTLFPAVGNFDFLTGLDFSNLPDFSDIDFSNIEIDAALQEYSDRIDAGEPEPFESFLPDPRDLPPASVGGPGFIRDAIRDVMGKIEVPSDIPPASTMPYYGSAGATPPENNFFVDGDGNLNVGDGIIRTMGPPMGLNPPLNMSFNAAKSGSALAPVEPIYTPPLKMGGGPSFDFSNIPMNFTGMPNMPNMPNMPVMPRIPQTTYIPPASSFIQPRVEEIVSPIRSGSLRNFQQPGLFNLV